VVFFRGKTIARELHESTVMAKPIQIVREESCISREQVEISRASHPGTPLINPLGPGATGPYDFSIHSSVRIPMFSSKPLTLRRSLLASSCISRIVAGLLLLVIPGIYLQPNAAAQKSAAEYAAATTPTDPTLAHGQIEYLWPSGAPGAVGSEAQDKPHLEIFTGFGRGPHSAVIVCPGGGYHYLEYAKEGTQIAEWLNLRGITAFVLTYRLAPRYTYPTPILDGYRAVRWVRSHADQYGISPDKIGMWGFSAGGHLVGIVGTHFDAGNPSAADPIDRVSDRPDFVISSYGGLTLQPGVAKPGAMQPMLGEHPSPEVIDDMSPDKHVTAQTPPYFLYATTKDQSVPVLSSVVFYTALVRAGVSAEIHIFAQGPHGTALAQGYPALSAWPELLENWLRLNGWIPERTSAPAH
jgi:acetyl esterase/lipase